MLLAQAPVLLRCGAAQMIAGLPLRIVLAAILPLLQLEREPGLFQTRRVALPPQVREVASRNG